jgi:tRNA modification GTPase
VTLPPSSPRDRSGYLAQDTIAAIGTAVGGALAMVRISGPAAFDALAKLTGRDSDGRAEERKLTRARLIDENGQELDDALFARFVQPRSYTGEDVVELQIHGGAYLSQRVMETLRAHGVRQALPGEFSFRAVRNGKLSVTQAQAVADLIAAANDGAIGLALEKLSGTQNRLLDQLATRLRQLAVLGEAGIDFADQDIDEVSLPQLKLRLAELIEALSRLRVSYDRGIKLQEGVSVAFVGLPNAGKSSFFNALLGEDRSIVSEIAGTTRDVVRERITLRGERTTLTLRLEDTAGLRVSDNPIERIGIERTQRSAREADLVLWLVDPATHPAAVREQWLALGVPASKVLGIFTKCDLFDAPYLSERKGLYLDLGVLNWVETSAQNGAGIPAAIEAILAHCERWTRRDRGEVLLTRLDQLHCVESALAHLQRAALASEAELFAADLRQALHALGPLIGETPADDILGKIFSEFCIGK